EFNHRTHMGIMFLFPKDCSLYKLKWRVAYIDRLLRQLAVCIDDDDATFNIQSSYQTPFLYISDDYEYWDAQLLLFPFLQWVSHWADFLARYFNAYPTALPLVNRLKNDLKNSQSLYDHFIDNSSDSILSYITRY
ncbi:MAG: hypothetical protein VW397_01610, partial [Candidatus Margulisiibacteriota bacterium]